MIKLSINLNKIALIRNSREGNYPSVVDHGRLCLDAGADGLTVHPRPDQRHIRPGDAHDLAKLVGGYPDREFNIEGNPFAAAEGSYPGFMALVEAIRPHQCTLVPDSSDQLTSDHGFDLNSAGTGLEPIIARLRRSGIRVSLFMDPDPAQIRLAREVGADRIELYTGPYAQAWGDKDKVNALHSQYEEAAQAATGIGLGVNAGHDLNLVNLVRFRAITGLQEVSIGHAFTVDSLAMGMAEAVKSYRQVLDG